MNKPQPKVKLEFRAVNTADWDRLWRWLLTPKDANKKPAG